MSAATLAYVLVTPARDEAALIEGTLRSVAAQTVRPARWAVVSDGSTDATEEIVARWSADHPWIELVRMPARRDRSFAGKAEAFRTGYARLRDVAHDAVGCLDADVTFDESYFAFLLERLVEDPRLGVVGTAFNGPAAYDYRFTSPEHVSAPSNSSGGDASRRSAGTSRSPAAAWTSRPSSPRG